MKITCLFDWNAWALPLGVCVTKRWFSVVVGPFAFFLHYNRQDIDPDTVRPATPTA